MVFFLNFSKERDSTKLKGQEVVHQLARHQLLLHSSMICFQNCIGRLLLVKPVNQLIFGLLETKSLIVEGVCPAPESRVFLGQLFLWMNKSPVILWQGDQHLERKIPSEMKMTPPHNSLIHKKHLMWQQTWYLSNLFRDRYLENNNFTLKSA